MNNIKTKEVNYMYFQRVLTFLEKQKINYIQYVIGKQLEKLKFKNYLLICKK